MFAEDSSDGDYAEDPEEDGGSAEDDDEIEEVVKTSKGKK